MNNKTIIPAPNSVHHMPESRQFNTDTETMHVFLDDSRSMEGTPLQQGKAILQQLSARLFQANTNIYLVGSKYVLHQILANSIRLNIDNWQSMVVNLWTANRLVHTYGNLFGNLWKKSSATIVKS